MTLKEAIKLTVIEDFEVTVFDDDYTHVEDFIIKYDPLTFEYLIPERVIKLFDVNVVLITHSRVNDCVCYCVKKEV